LWITSLSQAVLKKSQLFGGPDKGGEEEGPNCGLGSYLSSTRKESGSKLPMGREGGRNLPGPGEEKDLAELSRLVDLWAFARAEGRRRWH